MYDAVGISIVNGGRAGKWEEEEEAEGEEGGRKGDGASMLLNSGSGSERVIGTASTGSREKELEARKERLERAARLLGRNTMDVKGGVG